MKVTVESTNPTIEMREMKQGQLGIIAEGMHRDEVVVKVYGTVASLTNPHNTWTASPHDHVEIGTGIKVRLLGKGSKVTLEVEQ